MFNFLKRSNADKLQLESDNQAEKVNQLQEEVSQNQVENLANDQKNKELNFNEMIANLQEAMKIQAELGGKGLSVDDIFHISGLQPEELLGFLKGQELNIQASGLEVAKSIEQALNTLDDGRAKEGVMHKIANNKLIRSSFVALMLLAKFAPDAYSQEKPEKDLDLPQARVESNIDIKQEFNPDNTYQITPDEINSDKIERKNKDAKPLESSMVETGRFSQLEMANYFDTDSNFIPESSVSVIKADFEKFLSNITPNNAEQILQMDFKLFGSSDERPTNNWNGSNEELTTARLTAVEKILSETLQSYPFDNLLEDLAEQIRAKSFSQDMPLSVNGPEAGVTYIGDLLNPNTGQNYTEAEVNQIKNNNPNLYKKLLDDCRKITFSLESVKDDSLNKLVKKPPILETPKPELPERNTPPGIEILNNYQNIKLLFDNSPSVGNSYGYMAEVISKQQFNGQKVDFATFSNKLNRAKTFSNSLEVAEAINNLKFNGDSKELALSAAQEAIKKMPVGEKNAVFIMTDEPFQDASWENINNLEKLAAEKTADVYFYYADDKTKTVRQISLDEIKQATEIELLQASEARINGIISATERRIEWLTQQKNSHENRMARLADRDLNKDQQKIFQDAQIRMENASQQIADYQAQIADLRAARESGSLERVFSNNLVFSKYGESISRSAPSFKAARNISGENLGFEAIKLSTVEK